MGDIDDPEQVVRVLMAAAHDEIPLDELTIEQLYQVAGAHRRGREALKRTILALNDRGVTFAQIGAHFGVHESTAYRWAYPETKRKDPS